MMRCRRTPRGRVTPGGLMLLALLAGGGWFFAQPQANRTGLACGSIDTLTQWVQGDGVVRSDWDLKIRSLMQSLHTRCPELMNKQVAPLVDTAKEKAGRAVHTTITEGSKLKDQRGITVLDGRTLKIDGVGRAHLLGITIPDETEDASRRYLVSCCDGQHLVVEAYREKDAEGYPLVVVYLQQEGATRKAYAVNQHLLDRHLATPWTIPIGVEHWENR